LNASSPRQIAVDESGRLRPRLSWQIDWVRLIFVCLLKSIRRGFKQVMDLLPPQKIPAREQEQRMFVCPLSSEPERSVFPSRPAQSAAYLSVFCPLSLVF
jgi:hypothetical protein